MNPSGFFGSNGDGATDNPTAAASVYPSAGGSTVSVAASAGSDVTTAPVSGGQNAAAAGAGGGVLGQPLTWWVALIALFIGLRFVAAKSGNAAEFGNIRANAYNILTITFAAIIGIVGLKLVFNKVQVPGLSTLVAAV